jgi:hypothetical protein
MNNFQKFLFICNLINSIVNHFHDSLGCVIHISLKSESIWA